MLEEDLLAKNGSEEYNLDPPILAFLYLLVFLSLPRFPCCFAFFGGVPLFPIIFSAQRKLKTLTFLWFSLVFLFSKEVRVGG